MRRMEQIMGEAMKLPLAQTAMGKTGTRYPPRTALCPRPMFKREVTDVWTGTRRVERVQESARHGVVVRLRGLREKASSSHPTCTCPDDAASLGLLVRGWARLRENEGERVRGRERESETERDREGMLWW